MVYLVYRTPYETPLTRRVHTFPDGTLFDWFQRIWPEVVDDSLGNQSGRVDIELNGGMYCLTDDMCERGKAPDSPAELTKWLHGRRFGEGSVEAVEHAFQAYTDDDEFDLVTLVFDDEFRKQNPDRVEYLLQENWTLPERCDLSRNNNCFEWDGVTNKLQPIGADEGSVYACLFVIDDGGWLSDLLGPYQFQGVRLPVFAEFLRLVSDEVIQDSENIKKWFTPEKWRPEFVELRKIAVTQDADDVGSLLKVYDRQAQVKFESKPDNPRSYWKSKRLPSKIQISDHLAQIAFTERSTSRDNKSYDCTVSWVFFDDLWAATHAELASSILWAAKKDVPLF